MTYAVHSNFIKRNNKRKKLCPLVASRLRNSRFNVSISVVVYPEANDQCGLLQGTDSMNEKTTSFLHDYHNSLYLWNNKITEYSIWIKNDMLKELLDKYLSYGDKGKKMVYLAINVNLFE